MRIYEEVLEAGSRHLEEVQKYSSWENVASANRNANV